MNSRSKSGNHCAYLGISIDSVKSGFFYVQNLSSQRKDCLVRFIPGLFCRTSGGISLNDINFTVFRILIWTVCQFSRKSHTVENWFSTGHLSGFSGRIPCSFCKNGLFTDNLCNRRILLKEIGKLFAYNRINGCSGLTVAQLLFGLSFKLRFLNFNTDNRGNSLSDILAAESRFVIL